MSLCQSRLSHLEKDNVDLWKMQEEETYLDVKDSGDSALGEESAKIGIFKRKRLKYCYLGFCRKRNWHQKV